MTPQRGISWGPAVFLAAATMSLGACSAEPGAPSSGPSVSTGPSIEEEAGATPTADAFSAATPQAFVFESGTLEIGDFDPYTLGDNIFDPCTEITPAEFAAAGFDRVEPLPDEYAGLARGLSVCDVFGDDNSALTHFSNNNADFAVVSAQTPIIRSSSSALLPSVFTYGPSNGSSRGCFAQIDTSRGGLVAGAITESGAAHQDVDCELAVEMLENLFAVAGNQFSHQQT